MKVQEFPWAYLVVGTAKIDDARALLGRKLPGSKRKKALKMPCRPFMYKGQPAVGFYFAIGPGAEPVYKP